MFRAVKNDVHMTFQALQGGRTEAQEAAICTIVEKAAIVALIVLSHLTFTGNINISPTTFGVTTLVLGGVQFACRMRKLQLLNQLNTSHMGLFFEVLMVISIAVQAIMFLSARYPDVRQFGASVFSSYLTYALIRLALGALHYYRNPAAAAVAAAPAGHFPAGGGHRLGDS